MMLENWDNAYKVTIPLPIGGTRECVVFFESQYNELCMLLYRLASEELAALSRIAELELEVKRLQSVVDMLTGDLAS